MYDHIKQIIDKLETELNEANKVVKKETDYLCQLVTNKNWDEFYKYKDEILSNVSEYSNLHHRLLKILTDQNTIGQNIGKQVQHTRKLNNPSIIDKIKNRFT